MQNIFIENNLKNEESKSMINELLGQLSERIKLMETTWVIDRIEADFAVCENRDTGEIVNIKKVDLPENVRDGTVLKYINGKYELDKEKQEEIQKRIEEKMKKLWNN